MSPRRQRSWSAFVLGAATVLAAGLLQQTLLQPRPAFAQVPDSGLQRKLMLEELRQANKTLTEISKTLTELRDLEKKSAGQPGDDAKK
jgi:hypothetical protein